MITNDDNHDWINIIHTYYNCPHCKMGQLNNRVKRSFWVKNVFIWMDVKRYECNNCGKKTYIKNNN